MSELPIVHQLVDEADRAADHLGRLLWSNFSTRRRIHNVLQFHVG